jgi:Tfp pilus assembly protein PilF
MQRLAAGSSKAARPTWPSVLLRIALPGICVALLGGCGGRPEKAASGTSSVNSPPRAEAREAFDQGKRLINSDKPAAIRAFSRAIQLAPQYQPVYVWRGMAYRETGQWEKALADFTKAIELDPTDNYALEQRAQVYRHLGQSAKAQADEDRAAQLREKNREQLRKNVEEAKKRKKRP